MASTYPRDRAEFLTWAEAHTVLWGNNATQIGLTSAQATAFKDQVLALRAKVTAQEVAKNAQKAATETVVELDGDTRSMASDLVRAIRSYAMNSNDPGVYALAQIPAPGTATPVPPPGQPTDFKVELNSGGSITIKWKAKHPEGSDRVVYFVQRKLISQTAFTLIGGTGDRSYTDETLPIGIDGATYIVTSQRGSVQGQPSQQLSVTFGSAGGPPGVSFDLTENGRPVALRRVA